MIIDDKLDSDSIGYLVNLLRMLREEYNYYKKLQTTQRKEKFDGDPRFFKDWEKERSSLIWDTRRELNYQETQIKKVKKRIKRLNREQNGKE